MLSESERRVITEHCLDHIVATCKDCQRAYRLSEIGADVLGRRFHFCPTCRLDLTDALRLHLLSCQAISDSLEMRVKRSKILIKESEGLQMAAWVLAAESEALAQRVLETMRSHHAAGGPSRVAQIADVLVTHGPICAECLARQTDSSADALSRDIAQIRLSIHITEARGTCGTCGTIGTVISFGSERTRGNDQGAA